jgi:hypothetical protein
VHTSTISYCSGVSSRLRILEITQLGAIGTIQPVLGQRVSKQ